MALDAESLETDLKAALKTALDTETGASESDSDGDTHRQNFCNALAQAIAEKVLKHIQDNLVITGATVKIPRNTVITAVTGGGGAPAVGTLNESAIDCNINFNDDPDRLE